MTLVSVIVPCHNARRYIEAALASATSQTHPNLQIIVIDDGSTDDTAAIVRERFPQVTLMSQPNGGVSSARNLGLKLAEGEFIAFLDADDVWHPQKVEAQLALLQAHPDVLLCRSDRVDSLTDFDARQDLTAQSGLPRHHLVAALHDSFHHPYFATSTVMVRRRAIERTGGFDPRLRIAEDIDFYLRVLLQAPEVICLDFPAAFKRTVSGSLGDNSEYGYKQLIEVYSRLEKQHPQIRQLLTPAQIRRTHADLWSRLAASQRNKGKRLKALLNAARSLTLALNPLALKVIALTLTGAAPERLPDGPAHHLAPGHPTAKRVVSPSRF
ncbi:MAG: hypothetical protein RI907_1762 [Pseudomonadota bacterium]|jgi:glycosyltransferase involved in cell wall biosynthesis